MQAALPYLMGFTAMICYASLPVIAKKMNADIPSFAFIATTMFFLMSFSAIAAFFVEKDFSILEVQTKTWILLAAFAFINFVGFSLFLTAIKHIPVTEYQMIYLLAPLVSAGFAYLLLHEAFKIQYLIGFVFCAIGLFIALKR